MKKYSPNELIEIWENGGQDEPEKFYKEYKSNIDEIIRTNHLKPIVTIHDKDDKFKGAYKVAVINKNTMRLINNKVCYTNEALAYMSIIYGINEGSFNTNRTKP